MHGKAQREPTQRSVVLDCKLVPLHNNCQRLPAVCYITSMRQGWQCLPMPKYRTKGGQKLTNRSQLFLTKVHQIVACRGFPSD